MQTKVTQRICNLVPSKETEQDWRFQSAIQSGAVAAVEALPPSVDLRASWWPVGDQKNTGSCVGWGSTDGVMRYHLVKAGKIAEDQLLSPRFTWMASKETDEYVTRPETCIEQAGTSLKAALKICKKYGVVPDKLLPFDIDVTMYVDGEDDFFATAAQFRASGYFNLRKDLNHWRAWLVAHGPILVGLGVDHTWDHATDTNGLLDTFLPDTVRGGHAPCVVGYTTDNRFIIRNSWGRNWGDNGFAYASEAYITAGFFNESYGITI